MTREGATQRWAGPCLSVVLAALLWGALALERPAELSLSVPVLVEHLAPGMTVVSAPASRLLRRSSRTRIRLSSIRLMTT